MSIRTYPVEAKLTGVCECEFSQVNANGNVVRSEILGAVKMKCYLSGMPELRLGLNDKVMFESTGRSKLPSLLSLYCTPTDTI